MKNPKEDELGRSRRIPTFVGADTTPVQEQLHRDVANDAYRKLMVWMLHNMQDQLLDPLLHDLGGRR
jgi:hypothetical protein